MIELQLTGLVNPAFKQQFIPALPQTQSLWQWQARQFTVFGRECTILIEQATGYLMLFVDLDLQDALSFQSIWQQRLVAEAITVANLSDEQSRLLHEKILAHSQQLYSSFGASNEQLDEAVLAVQLLARQHQQLPDDLSHEFRWGVILNQARENGGYSAYHRFSQLCRYWAQPPLCTSYLENNTELH